MTGRDPAEGYNEYRSTPPVWDGDHLVPPSPHSLWEPRHLEIICFRCRKTPQETHGSFAEPEQTAEEYVIEEEGTFNTENGHYACDECYIAIGMPTRSGGWVAP